MTATPVQRPQNQPPSHAQVERMVAAMRVELAAARTPRKARYWQAAIDAMLWVLGDPQHSAAPLSGRVLGQAPSATEIYTEVKWADDVLHGRRERPDAQMTSDEIQGYEHNLFWAATGREAMIELDE